MAKKKNADKKPDSKENETEDLKAKLARALADYDNLSKRADAEKEAWIKFSGQRIIYKLIPVLDNLDSALKHSSDPGLAIAVAEFRKVLSEEELEEIPPKVKDEFDENLHEAIEAVEGGEKGKIAEVILNGWKFKDGQVIRHAKVKVFSKKIK